MGRCNGSPQPSRISHLPATRLENNRQEKKCSTQQCFYRFVYSFQLVLVQAEYWLPKPTKRRKRYFELDLRVLSMGLPNFLPGTSVSTVCFRPMMRRTFPVRMSPSSQGPDPLGTRTRQGST